MLIHPVYDVSTRTWFMPECPSAEAPTIRQLIQKLGIGPERVKDYYPGGIPLDLLPRRMAGDGKVREVKFRQPKQSRHARRKLTGETLPPRAAEANLDLKTYQGSPQGLCNYFTELENKILDLWLRGFSAVSIAADVGRKQSYVNSTVIPKARRLGDPRAVFRLVGRPPTRTGSGGLGGAQS